MSRENYSYLFPCTAIFDPGNISMILEQTVNQSAFLRFFQRSWGVFFFFIVKMERMRPFVHMPHEIN